MEFIQIEVRVREERGTAAVNRLRREGFIPAVLYGLKRRNLSISFPAVELKRFVGSGAHLVELKMGDETRDAILREVQQDPLTDQILHVDLQRVDKDVSVEDQVQISFKGTAHGTTQGGLFQGAMDHLRVSARPRDLPEGILLDVSGLDIGDAIYVRDVELPDVVTVLDQPDELVAHVVAMRGIEGEEGAEGEEGEDAPAEPELVGKDGEAGSSEG